MVSKQQLQATVYTLSLLLVTGMPLVPAQPLQLVYIDRPGDNRILLECRQTVTSVAVTSPQIWVERFDLTRQPVTVVGNQGGRVAIEITQDLEGFYSCSYNGDKSSNTVRLIGKESCHQAYPNESNYYWNKIKQSGWNTIINHFSGKGGCSNIWMVQIIRLFTVIV